MPIYEYKCLECGKNIEVIQKFSDAPLSVCVECGGEMKKLISNSSFVLKGTGWYVTDYASADRKKGQAADKGTSGKKSSDSGTETKSESKTETKSESNSETKTETKTEQKAETKTETKTETTGTT